MLTLNVITEGEVKRISGSVNGEMFNIPYTTDAYNALDTLKKEYVTLQTASEADDWTDNVLTIIEESKQDLLTEVCEFVVKSSSGSYHITDGVEVSPIAIPRSVVSVIEESINKDLDPSPVIKAFTRFLDNPNISQEKAELFGTYITAIIVDKDNVTRLVEEEGFSVEAATNSSRYNDVMITEEGLLVTYKYADLITEGYVIEKQADGTTKAVKKPVFGKEEDTIDKHTGEITEGAIKGMPTNSDGIDIVDDESVEFLPPVKRETGDAFYSKSKLGHEIHVGTLVELKGESSKDDTELALEEQVAKGWKMVNCNDSVSCVKGLHVGGRQYVASYGWTEASHLLMCFVDPREIGAFVGCNQDQLEDRDGAIRVRSYYTYGAVKGRTAGLYHSSKYAAMSDAQWGTLRAAAIKNAQAKMEQIAKENNL